MVDFPFEYPSGDIVPEVRERWLKNCAFNLLDDHLDGMKSLQGVYLDCGTLDELQMSGMVEAFVAKLDVAGVDYNYETFDSVMTRNLLIKNHLHINKQKIRQINFFNFIIATIVYVE